MRNRDTEDSPFIAEITIDKTSGTPLHQQISAPLAALIQGGDIEPGRLIEDEVSLASRLNVSRPTARRALQDLVVRGLLERRRGAGTRVTPRHIQRKIALTSLNDDLVKAGYQTDTRILNYSINLADAHAAHLLQCPEGSEIVSIERLRSINDTPLALMTNMIRADHAPTLTQLSTHGLYECLQERGLSLASATQTIGARIATPEESAALRIDNGAALVTMQRTAYGADGSVIEYGNHVYDASQYQVTIPLVADQK